MTNLNWPLLGVTLLISAFGLLNLYSATTSFEPGGHAHYFRDQLIYTFIGMGLMIMAMSISYKHFNATAYLIYGFSLLLLVAVLLIGRKVHGSQSWIALGSIRFQPSEFAKLGLVIGLSKQLSGLEVRTKAGLRDLVPVLAIFIVPTVLVILQHDLGTSLFFGLIAMTLILTHGVRWQIVVVVAGLAAVLAVVGYLFFLSPYQKDRVKAFMHPEWDRKGAGYHLVQSKIAVGSGGWTGKGYLKGQTHKLKFIPERHTDFIFSVWAEEWGFLGSVGVMLLFFAFLFLTLDVSKRAPDRFSFYLTVGAGSIFFWHLVINLGGILGLMPLTGVPLPFFSYGGSALLDNWIALGLVLNVSMRRFVFT